MSKDMLYGLSSALLKSKRAGVRQVHNKKGVHYGVHNPQNEKTYNTRDSLVVTHPTTSLAVTDLSMGERTGSRAFQCLWSYVTDSLCIALFILAP